MYLDAAEDEELPVGLSSTPLHQYLSKRLMFQLDLCKSIYLSRKALFTIPYALTKACQLQALDLSSNRLTRFPGDWAYRSFPQLTVLRLEFNCLHRLEDILELSKCLHLQELSIHENPLRLLNNRLYLLEAMFTSPKPSKKRIQSLRRVNPAPTEAVAKTPRYEGFPMLDKLNQEWITHDQVKDVEHELARSLLYCEGTGATRAQQPIRQIRSGLDTCQRFRTVVEKKRALNANSFIPTAAPIPKFVGAVVENGNTVERSRPPSPSSSELSDTEWEEIQSKLKLGRVITSCREIEDFNHSADTQPHGRSRRNGMMVSTPEPCSSSYMSSFTDLTSTQRDFIRLRSKTTSQEQPQPPSESPFENTGLVDCIIQVQRSRQLAETAKTALKQKRPASAAAVSHVGVSEYKPIGPGIEVGEHKIQLDFHGIIHEQRRENNKRYGEILKSSSSVAELLELPLSARGQIDMNLKRLHLKNEIDFAPQIITPKNEKRYIKALIDSDRAVFEEETVRQRQQEHLRRLKAIKYRDRPRPQGKKKSVKNNAEEEEDVSSWQQRNLRAEKYKSSSRPNRRKARPGMIETVEAARLDTLPHANSRQVILRCADIRRNAKNDLRDLENAKHAFIQQELEWEKIRTNKLAVLTRKIQREFERDGGGNESSSSSGQPKSFIRTTTCSK